MIHPCLTNRESEYLYTSGRFTQPSTTSASVREKTILFPSSFIIKYAHTHDMACMIHFIFIFPSPSLFSPSYRVYIIINSRNSYPDHMVRSYPSSPLRFVPCIFIATRPPPLSSPVYSRRIPPKNTHAIDLSFSFLFSSVFFRFSIL